jgi:hypothetical protein
MTIRSGSACRKATCCEKVINLYPYNRCATFTQAATSSMSKRMLLTLRFSASNPIVSTEGESYLQFLLPNTKGLPHVVDAFIATTSIAQATTCHRRRDRHAAMAELRGAPASIQADRPAGAFRRDPISMVWTDSRNSKQKPNARSLDRRRPVRDVYVKSPARA